MIRTPSDNRPDFGRFPHRGYRPYPDRDPMMTGIAILLIAFGTVAIHSLAIVGVLCLIGD